MLSRQHSPKLGTHFVTPHIAKQNSSKKVAHVSEKNTTTSNALGGHIRRCDHSPEQDLPNSEEYLGSFALPVLPKKKKFRTLGSRPTKTTSCVRTLETECASVLSREYRKNKKSKKKKKEKDVAENGFDPLPSGL